MNSINDDSVSSKARLYFREKIVGEVDGDTARLFVTPRHWFQAGNGYSVDPGVIDQLGGEIKWLEFYDRKAGTRERLELDTFLANSWETRDYGWGTKLVCSSRHYEGHESSSHIPPPPAPSSAQLGLFGAAL